MTPVIADTDILSTFGKLGRTDLLQKLFSKIYVAPAVYRELGTAERMGFAWIKAVKEAVELLPPTKDEVEEGQQFAASYPQLGSGEIESDLEDLLRAFKLKSILTVAALKHLMDQIEKEDRTRIKAKDQILKD